MKKVLLAGTALLGVVALTHTASADMQLDLGGYFRGYAVNVNEDNDTNQRNFDFRRDSELHFNGETTLDNGLTVGFHAEQKLGGTIATDEVYSYFSGQWGRVNFGSEDGVAYLLQVAAPSGDSNIDGLRSYIQGWNGNDQFTIGTISDAAKTKLSATLKDLSTQFNTTALDYQQAFFRQAEKLTYLTPKFSGFQAGISYAPEPGQNSGTNNIASMSTNNNFSSGTIAGGTYTADVGSPFSVRFNSRNFI